MIKGTNESDEELGSKSVPRGVGTTNIKIPGEAGTTDMREATETDDISAMNSMPPPEAWSAAAVRLLQGVVYHDDNSEVWDALLRSASMLTGYFSKLGLMLVVDETDGLAYLRQQEEEETETNTTSVPRLFRRTQLGYDPSLLCVLLRDLLRQWEEDDVQNQRCVVSQSDLLAMWQAFFGHQTDGVRLNRSLNAALKRLEELKFVKQFEKEPASWEIRRILKIRLPLADLERWKQRLFSSIQSRDVTNVADHECEGAESDGSTGRIDGVAASVDGAR